MKVSILGAGDREKVHKHSGFSETELNILIKDVGHLLAKLGVELVLVPAKGIPSEVARAYKAAGGRKVIGLVPKQDTKYGIEHIQSYLDIADEQVDIGTWYDLNGEIAAQSEVAICIGLSPGAMLDMCFLKYHYKFLGSKTLLIIFENTFSGRLPPEVEEDLCNIAYITSIKELEDLLKP